MNTRVEKSTPEEAAVIQNMASLIQQLQAMGVGDQSFQQPGDPSQGPNGAPGQGGQPVQGAAFKSGEGAEGNTGEQAFDRTEDPQNDTSPEGPTARRPMMRNARIQKGEMTGQEKDVGARQDDGDLLDTAGEGHDSTPGEKPVVAKELYASENDGTQNLDDANTILFDDLPESTQENVKDIRKALRSIGLDVAPMKKPVRKSIGGGNDEMSQLRQQIGFLANTMGEIIEAFGVTKAVAFDDPAAPRSVQKSRPAANYSGQEDIASVLKSLVTEIRNERAVENEEANPWHSPEVVKKSMRQFTENMSGIAGGLWPKQ
jgi:hypothetical protein